MASRTAVLRVDIVADARRVRQGTAQAESHLSKFQKSMNKMTVPAALIGAGLFKISSDMGKLASDAEQNMGAINAVFGNNAKEVENWSKNSAKSLGLSSSEYNKQMAAIGGALKNAGLPMEQVAGKANELTGAAADLSSVFGGSTAEAAGAMGAALRGEFDSLERFGVFMNQTKINSILASTGQDKLTGSALEGAKKQAILNEIMKQAGPYLGNFTKEADTAAGAQQRATAAWADAQAKLGEQLLPYLVRGAELLSSFATWASENSSTVTVLVGVLAGLAGAILIINVAMAVMNAIALLNPFVFLAVAVLALIAAIVLVATQTTFFQDVWTSVSKFCADVWNGFIRAITDAWNGFWGFLSGILGNIGTAFNDVFNGARNIVSGVIDSIVGGFNNVVNAVSSAIDWVSRLFSGFSVPGWMQDVMNFMGMGGTGIEMNAAFLPALAGLPEGVGATGFILPPSSFGGSSGGTTYVTNNTFNIDGALDTDGVARQIDKLLTQQSRNRGFSSAAGGF